jgi:hypothetical protein
MAAFSEKQIPADRFAEYIIELHELSGTHGIPCGKSEDLVRLVEALRNSEAFATDFRSMIRSIVFREDCHASESQLLTLVLIAWGGVKADGPILQLPSVIREVRSILHEILTGIASEPSTLPAESSEVLPDLPSDVGNTIREIEEISPDVQLYRQLLKMQDKGGARTDKDSVSSQPGTEVRDGEPDSAGSGASIEVAPIPWPEPSGSEILALALTGLVIALLFSVGSLPIYRTRVSVFLPTVTTGATNSLANSGSLGSLLRNGELTEKAAERLLALPHQNPIYRQDALSRGERDLHLGGSETILYADLVADTAGRVRVKQLQPSNLYEITCDSWNSRFAETFCNELIDMLHEQPGGATSSQPGVESARSVDAALGPGIQIYPDWYRQGLAGLAVGCVVGVAVGFVKRPVAKANSGEGAT